MSRLLKLYSLLLSYQIRSQMQYRFSFWSELLSTAYFNASYIFVVLIVINQFGGVAGWTMGEVAFLTGMVEMSFGIMDMIFSGFDGGAFSELVRLGRFDQFLLRPMNITIQVLGSRFLLRRLGRVMEGAVFFTVAVFLAKIDWTVWKILYLPVLLVSQVIAFGALFIFGATIVFWTTREIEAVNIVTYGGVEMMSYPMNVYPEWLRGAFTYVLPFIFLNYYPALYIMGKPDPLHFPPFAPFMAPMIAVFMMLASLGFWRFGINHYQGTGS